jgi:hypothetical protein
MDGAYKPYLLIRLFNGVQYSPVKSEKIDHENNYYMVFKK